MPFSGRESEDVAGDINAAQNITQGVDGPLFGRARVLSAGSLSARYLQDRFADVINIKDFGAKVDGSTDDGASIVAAFAAAAPTGATVVFPAGTCVSSSAIVASDGTSIKGAGGVARGYDTILSNGRGSRFYYTGSGTALTLGSYSRLEGLAVQANSGSGITLQDARMTHLLDVAISAGGDKGLFLGSTNLNKGTGWCTVSDFDIVAPSPLVLQPTAPGWVNVNAFRNGIVRSSSNSNAIRINGANNLLFDGVDASYYGTSVGVAAYNIYGNTKDVTIVNGYIEAPFTANYIGLSLAAGTGSIKWLSGYNGAQTPVNNGSTAVNNIFAWFTTGGGATDIPSFGTISSRLSPYTLDLATQSGYIYQGSGVPDNAKGNNGDSYFRTDTPGVANQRLYIKSAGAWVGIV